MTWSRPALTDEANNPLPNDCGPLGFEVLDGNDGFEWDYEVETENGVSTLTVRGTDAVGGTRTLVIKSFLVEFPEEVYKTNDETPIEVTIGARVCANAKLNPKDGSIPAEDVIAMPDLHAAVLDPPTIHTDMVPLDDISTLGISRYACGARSVALCSQDSKSCA